MPQPEAVSLDPLLLLAIAGVVAMTARAVRRRGEAGPWRRAALAMGGLLLVLVWLTPVETLALHYILTAHLVQIIVLMGVVPPLLLLALPPRQQNEAGRDGPGALAVALPRLGGGAADRLTSRLGRIVSHPAMALVLVNAVFLVLHVSAVYDLTLRVQPLYDLGQVALLLASIAFWWPIVCPQGRRPVLSPLGKLGYILLATIPQTFLGITLALSPHLVYTGYAGSPGILGLDAMTDQEAAGACMAMLSKIALFTAFSLILKRMFDQAESGDDDGGGRGPDPEPAPQPPGRPGWLSDLERGRLIPEPAPARRGPGIVIVERREPATSSGRPER